MRKLIFLQIILMILLSISVVSVAVTQDLDNWNYPEENIYNTNTLLNTVERGHFDDETFLAESNGAGSSSFNPVSGDFNISDDSSNLYTAIIEGSSLALYDQDLGFLDEYVLNQVPIINPIIKTYDNITRILTANSTHVNTFIWNESSERIELDYSTAYTHTPATSFVCLEDEDSEALNDWCMASTSTGSYIIFFDMDDGSLFYDATGESFEGIIFLTKQPLLFDIDRDNYPNFIIGASRVLGSTQYVYIYNYEINRVMGTYGGETSFGADGKKTTVSKIGNDLSTSSTMSNIKLIQFDGGGDYEIFYSAGFTCGDEYGCSADSVFDMVKSDGSNYDGFPNYDGASSSNSVYIQSRNYDAQVCYFDSSTPTPCYSKFQYTGNSQAGLESYVRCYNENDSILIQTDEGGKFKCRDMDSDNVDDFVKILYDYGGSGDYESSIQLVDIDEEEISETIDLSTSSLQKMVVNDLDGDLEVDVLLSGTDGTELYKSTWSNELPEWDYVTNGGIYGYYPTACLDTINKFYVKEDLSSPSDYSYTNDLGTDLEQICLVNGSEYDCGSSDDFTPYYSVYHDEAGFFTYTFVMTDDSNVDSYTNEKEITVLVIDGDEGETCNIASDLIVSPLTGGTAISGSSSSGEFDTKDLFQGDDYAMLIAGLVLIIGMAIGGAKAGGSTGLLFGGFMGAFIGVILGWISAWILVITLMIIFAIAIVKATVFGSSNSGGE